MTDDHMVIPSPHPDDMTTPDFPGATPEGPPVAGPGVDLNPIPRRAAPDEEGE